MGCVAVQSKKSIQRVSKLVYQSKGLVVITEDLPGLGYIRNFCTILWVISETLTAYLGKQEKWQQLFTDGTSWRQISLQNLIISIVEDDILRPLVLSSAIILEGETSEQQCNSIAKVIKYGGKRLRR